MKRPSDFGMREHLTGFLIGNDSVLEFQRWFARAMGDIEDEADDSLYELALHIENRLAEFTGGHIDVVRLRAVLRDELDGAVASDLAEASRVAGSVRSS